MKDIRSYLIRQCKSSSTAAKLSAYFDDPSLSARLGLLLNERVLNMPPEIAPSLHESMLEDIKWAQTNVATGERNVYRFDHLLLVAPCWSEKTGSAAIDAHAATLRDATTSAARFTAKANSKKDKAAPKGSSAASSAEAEAESASEDESGSGSASASAAESHGDFLTHYYHFEEELFKAQADLSYTFTVAPRDNVTHVPAMPVASSSSAAAAAADDDEEDDMPVHKPLRGPETRRVIVFKASKLQECVTAMHHLLALAGESLGATASATAATTAASSGSSGSGGKAKAKSGSNPAERKEAESASSAKQDGKKKHK